jgi:TrmH family RNA methyltransferase
MRVVLCGVRHPGNVGAAARAMKTMGLADLALVAPEGPWRTEEARWLAHESEDVFDGAREFGDVAAAVADCVLVVGTTSRRRHRDVRFLDPERAAALLREASASGPVAIVFGSERTGLTNDELALCHHVARVPAAVRQPSLNLAQTVMLFAYAWHRAGMDSAPPRAPTLARSASVEAMFAHLESSVALRAFPENVRKALLLSLRNLLSRAFLREREVNLFHTLAAQIERRLAQAREAQQNDGSCR